MRDARLLAHLSNAAKVHIHLEYFLIVPIKALDYLADSIGYLLAIIDGLLFLYEFHDILDR